MRMFFGNAEAVPNQRYHDRTISTPPHCMMKRSTVRGPTKVAYMMIDCNELIAAVMDRLQHDNQDDMISMIVIITETTHDNQLCFFEHWPQERVPICAVRVASMAGMSRIIPPIDRTKQ
jgi:hypothetical protein